MIIVHFGLFNNLELLLRTLNEDSVESTSRAEQGRYSEDGELTKGGQSEGAPGFSVTLDVIVPRPGSVVEEASLLVSLLVCLLVRRLEWRLLCSKDSILWDISFRIVAVPCIRSD